MAPSLQQGIVCAGVALKHGTMAFRDMNGPRVMRLHVCLEAEVVSLMKQSKHFRDGDPEKSCKPAGLLVGSTLPVGRALSSPSVKSKSRELVDLTFPSAAVTHVSAVLPAPHCPQLCTGRHPALCTALHILSGVFHSRGSRGSCSHLFCNQSLTKKLTTKSLPSDTLLIT